MESPTHSLSLSLFHPWSRMPMLMVRPLYGRSDSGPRGPPKGEEERLEVLMLNRTDGSVLYRIMQPHVPSLLNPSHHTTLESSQTITPPYTSDNRDILESAVAVLRQMNT